LTTLRTPNDTARPSLLRDARHALLLATAALVGIAATVAITDRVEMRAEAETTRAREAANVARQAFSLAIDRETGIRGYLLTRDSASLTPELAARGALAAALDSLALLTTDDPARHADARTLRAALDEWERDFAVPALRDPANPRWRAPGPDGLAGKRSFDVVRARFGAFLDAENAIYGASAARVQRARQIAASTVVVEVAALALVILWLRRRLLRQAREIDRARLDAEAVVAEQTALFAAMTDVIFVLDREGRYLKVAPTRPELRSRAAETLLGRRVPDVLPAASATRVLETIRDVLDHREPRDLEYAFEIDGREEWYQGSVAPLDAERVIWVARDVTSLRHADEARRESERRYRQLVDLSPDAIVVQQDGEIVFANPAMARLVGAESPEQLVGMPVLDVVHPDDRRIVTERHRRNIEQGTPTERLELRLVRLDGVAVPVEAVGIPFVHRGRAAVQSVLRDVTERRAAEERLAHQAVHDPLTGLPNRVLLRDRVSHALARAARGAPQPAVLYLDLDDFKRVNDNLSHAAGDALLVEVARRACACLRAADTCARLGGDEFAVLLEDVPDAATAMATARRMVAALGAPFEIGGASVVMSVSVGVAVASAGTSADELLRNADLAMYRAKGGGRARAELYAPEMHTAVRRRFELEAELRRVIEGGEGAGALVLHYQPIVDVRGRQVCAAEALVRWEHPTRGLVPPLEFIPLAEESGLVLPLGRWVLAEACRQLGAWRAAHGTSLSVSVNLSGRQLAGRDLLSDVTEALTHGGVPASRLLLEMTESTLVEDNRVTLERLHALRAMGARLAIDDFGTGYSSLAYLERFPIEVLKIDRAFVRGLGGDAPESPITHAVIGLARALGMTVVAEGVETERQLERLRELGCDRAQGYLFARPLPAAAMSALLPGPDDKLCSAA
jgi:diguanylate cyclase (GGDEF)-like protein/PAS domain S-box-containing protein